jgi:hypothetical protein
VSTLSPTTADPAGYALAFDEAKRALDDQERVLDELHTRAATLVAAAALVTSFFGGQALHTGHVPTFGWIAFSFFVVLAISVLVVLWPRRLWEFDVSPASLIATYLEPSAGLPTPLPGIQRDLALHMGNAADSNRGVMRILFVAFRVGTIALVLEVLAWAILPAGGA